MNRRRSGFATRLIVMLTLLFTIMMFVTMRSFTLAPLMMFWVPVVIALLFVLMGGSRLQQQPPQRRYNGEAQRRSPSGQVNTTGTLSPKQLALRAVRRAGNDPTRWKLSLDDIGLLAYHGDRTPDISRTRPVSSDVTHIRPYLVIDLPYKQGKGTITLRLLDETGEKRFESKQVYSLIQGQNLITTRTWLPLAETRSGGRWSLEAFIGDMPLAVHQFEMRPAYEGQIKEFMGTDGEIDPWLARAVSEQSVSETLSLDELLADQYDDAESTSSAASLR